jgi:hypothetical protein
MNAHLGMTGALAGFLLVATLGVSHAAAADFEVAGPDGRRILLKDDKTWRYVEKTEGDKPAEQALLRIENRVQLGNGCRYGLRLVNNLPYEITSLVPQFSAHQASGVLYETVFKAFARLRPTDSQYQEIQFRLACSEITEIKVSGADRCEMGDLDKFSYEKGKCLERVRLGETDFVRFTK